MKRLSTGKNMSTNAGILSQWVAFLFDSIMISYISDRMDKRTNESNTLICEYVIYVLFPMLMAVYMIHSFGCTIGQYLMEIRIVNIQDNAPASLRQIVLKTLCLDGVLLHIPILFGNTIFTDLITYIYILISCVFTMNHPNHLCIHDIISSTKIIKLTF